MEDLNVSPVQEPTPKLLISSYCCPKGLLCPLCLVAVATKQIGY
jgi:hypothetical protein